jgi:hypothetical protein
MVKDERGDFLADPQKILCVQGAVSIRQIEIHTAEPFVSDRTSAEDEAAIMKSKRYKAPGSDQIPAELIQAGGGYHILRYIHLLC